MVLVQGRPGVCWSSCVEVVFPCSGHDFCFGYSWYPEKAVSNHYSSDCERGMSWLGEIQVLQSVKHEVSMQSRVLILAQRMSRGY